MIKMGSGYYYRATIVPNSEDLDDDYVTIRFLGTASTEDITLKKMSDLLVPRGKYANWTYYDGAYGLVKAKRLPNGDINIVLYAHHTNPNTLTKWEVKLSSEYHDTYIRYPAKEDVKTVDRDSYDSFGNGFLPILYTITKDDLEKKKYVYYQIDVFYRDTHR
eukprot:375864_1